MSFFEELKFDDDNSKSFLRQELEKRRRNRDLSVGIFDQALKLAMILHDAHIQLIRIEQECDEHAAAIAKAAIAKIEEGLNNVF